MVSCTVYKSQKADIETTTKMGEELKAKGKKVMILGVLKTSGEKIEFPKKNPATIQGDSIIGRTEKTITVELEVLGVEKITHKKKLGLYEILMNDGKIYFATAYRTTEDKLIYDTYEPISIPFSEIDLVWVKKVDPAGTFFASIGGVALSLLGLLVIIALTKESCPFIYSFDGENFIFDAEPYGGATCQGMKRTEWCNLDFLKEVNGQYEIMITNEIDETQYTDELSLVVVDHPQGFKVVPDERGNIHTVSQPTIPLQAYDKSGRDLMPYIFEDDWVFWQSKIEEKKEYQDEDLKDELIFEFSKPEGATEGKLLFNGCNTLWASQMVKQYLELYGSDIHKYYENLEKSGPAKNTILLWTLREELYKMQIRVETEDGWKSKGIITGGGPFVSENKIHVLDLKDVPGDILRIKLTPAVKYWKINYLSMDFTENAPVTFEEIKAMEAQDHENRDVREILSQVDNNYHVMPNIGDHAKLTYTAPPSTPGMARSVILKATGYYDIHLNSTGACQQELLHRILTEPGFSIKYSLEKYFQWEKKLIN